MKKTGTLAGLAACALMGVATPAWSAPAATATPDGVHSTPSPRAVAPTVTAADQTTVFEAESVMVTVQVSAPGTTPTGTVTVSEAGTVLGSGAMSGGTAVVSLPRDLAVGRHALTASYSGDGTTDPGTASFLLTVLKADVKMDIQSPSAFGEIVTVYVNAPFVPGPAVPSSGFNGATPTGTVTLYEGKRELGSGSVDRLTSSMTASSIGVARIDVPARRLPLGRHVLTAVYSGGQSFNSARITVPVKVTKATSAIDAEVGSSDPRRGRPVRLDLTATNGFNLLIPGRAVVKVAGRSYAVQLPEGTATVKLRGLGRGKHVARVFYLESRKVSGSKTKVTITVR